MLPMGTDHCSYHGESNQVIVELIFILPKKKKLTKKIRQKKETNQKKQAKPKKKPKQKFQPKLTKEEKKFLYSIYNKTCSLVQGRQVWIYEWWRSVRRCSKGWEELEGSGVLRKGPPSLPTSALQPSSEAMPSKGSTAEPVSGFSPGSPGKEDWSSEMEWTRSFGSHPRKPQASRAPPATRKAMGVSPGTAAELQKIALP